MQTLPLSLSLLLLAAVHVTAAGRPNIIFLLTDDQRWDSVGFMGEKIGQTPNLDKLAADGIVFENAFVTSAICTPSRACYLLGQFERRHGVNFNSGTAMAPEAWEKSYPVLLRKNGYFTGYIGKNHLPIGNKGYFSGIMEKSFDFWYAGHHHIGFYPKELHEIFDNAAADTQPEVLTEGALAFLDPDPNETFIKGAVGFLENRPDKKPFCLSICMNLPHGFSVDRMQQRPTDDDLYRTTYREWQETLPLPEHYLAKADIRQPKISADLLLADLRQTGYDWVDSPSSVREYNIRVMQAITGIDRLVGTLRAKLAELGLAENTVILFSSDHGLFSGEHGLGGKALCYDTTLRVPFLIYDPRIPGGRRMPQLVQSIDVAPTLLGLAGVPVPDSMQGADIAPLIRDEKTPWRTAAFGENLWSTLFGNPRCETVRTAEYRYIRYFKNDNRAKRDRTPESRWYTVSEQDTDEYAGWLTATIKGEQPVYEELFHTASDPYEANNLTEDPAFAKTLENLRTTCDMLLAAAKGDANTPPATVRIKPEHTRTHYRKHD